MFQINFKVKKEPMVVDDNRGKELMEYLASGPKISFVKVNGEMVSISSIRSVEPIKASFSPREFNKSDVVQLMNTLKNDYTQKRIDGILVSRIDQYLIDQGAVRFNNGLCTVLDPANAVRIRGLFEEVRKMEYGIEKGLEATIR